MVCAIAENNRVRVLSSVNVNITIYIISFFFIILSTILKQIATLYRLHIDGCLFAVILISNLKRI